MSDVKKNHIYTVEMRIDGKDLNPDDITGFLNLKPVNTSNTVSIKRADRRPFWGYN